MAASGRRRHWLRIESPETVAGSFGDQVLTWVTLFEDWGCIEPLQGRELWQAQQVSPNLGHKVTLRYREGLTVKMRVIYRERIFQIGQVKNIGERDVTLELLCAEEVT
jgi:SPP1 family predicted phage head-tail adaptor